MKWLDHSVRIDAGTAALIAADLRRVAEIDGHLHARELSLIEAFEREIPESSENTPETFESDEIRQAYLRSLIMLAMADGDIAEEERNLIVTLAAGHGLSEQDVESTIETIKSEFLSIFSGVNLFRQSLMGLAEGMGLDAKDVDEMWD